MNGMSGLTHAVGKPPEGLLARSVLGEPSAGIEPIEEQLAELRVLAALPGLLDQTIGVILPERPRDYRAFWTQARAVAGLFRTTYLRRADRGRLWHEFSELCERVKDLGLAEREERAAASAVTAESVRSLLREAEAWVRGAESSADFAEVRARLGKAMDLLKSAPFNHRDRQVCFTAWREVANRLDNRRAGLHGDNYDAIERRIRDAAREVSNADTFQATGLLRELQADIRAADLGGDQRRIVREEMRELWGVLIRRIKARKAERARIDGERARQTEAWRDRQAQRLDDLEAWREANDRGIERLESEAEELEQKIAEAWNDGWAERAREWVRAKYERIRALEARNVDLERQMAETRRRVGR